MGTVLEGDRGIDSESTAGDHAPRHRGAWASGWSCR